VSARPILLYVVNEAYFFLSHRLPVARAAQNAGFDVHVAAPDDHVWAPEGFRIEALREAGFAYHVIPLVKRGTNPFEELATFAAIWRLLGRLRPALVHTLTIKPVLYGGLAARLVGVPGVVAGITGLGQMFSGQGAKVGALRALAGIGYRLALGHARARAIVQNAEDGETLLRIGALPGERLRLIRGSGVALGTFAPSEEPTTGAPLVILPARLIWDKGVGEFVEAARYLKAAGTRARFALVGDTKASNPRSVPETQLRSWHEEGAVEWWGRREDMPAVLASASIVCLPSTYGEGVPKVLIEAAASARSIVATNIGGCREIARHEENGLLVPPGDAKALAAALSRLIEDAALRRRYGARGREIAVAEFSDVEVAAKTLAIYRELVGTTVA